MAKHWLLSWNPTNWEWENLPEFAAKVRRGNIEPIRWSCSSKQPEVGDTAWLMRLGKNPKGIIGYGQVTRTSFEEPHYNEEKARAGESSSYIELEFQHLEAPTDNCALTLHELEGITVESQQWTPQSSGVEIKPRSASMLQGIWQTRYPDQSQDQSEIKATPMTDATNTIFYLSLIHI